MELTVSGKRLLSHEVKVLAQGKSCLHPMSVEQVLFWDDDFLF
jgi:hypothetical protein